MRDNIEFLFDRINYERRNSLPYNENRLKLANMRRLLEFLGDPQKRYPIVHIAGTKGKGSVATMLSTVLKHGGYKVGTYTSPHFVHVRERFAINGEHCGQEDLDGLITHIRPFVMAMDEQAAREERPRDRPTFFEITTAIAFVYFANQKVDFAVIEVGLGGRLDSTNVCDPLLSLITSISLDHTRQLGESLGQIAAEKAGIIKSKVPVVSGVIATEPREVIRQIAQQQNSPLWELDRDFRVLNVRHHPECMQHGESTNGRPHFQLSRPRLFDVETQFDGQTQLFEDLSTALPGDHQIANAAVAVAAAKNLSAQFPHIDESAIRSGLAAAFIQGRIELIPVRPPVILDVAHNVASVQALVDTIGPSLAGREPILIFAVSRDKDYVGMLNLLLPRFQKVIFTRFVENPRARHPQELLEAANNISAASGVAHCQFEVCDQPIDAWHRAKQLATQNSVLCLAGSAFLIAELREFCRE